MIQDCIWRDASEPDANGNRWLACQREGCSNRMFGNQPHEHYKANCRAKPPKPPRKARTCKGGACKVKKPPEIRPPRPEDIQPPSEIGRNWGG